MWQTFGLISRYSEEQIKQIEEIGKFALEAQTELDVIKLDFF